MKNKWIFLVWKKKMKPPNTIIIRNITNLFEHEEDYYKPVSVGDLWSNNHSNVKVMLIRKQKPLITPYTIEGYLNKIIT